MVPADSKWFIRTYTLSDIKIRAVRFFAVKEQQ
jgi:hypothetical protein